VRFGFPILDRVGHSYFPTVAYMGAMRLAEKILSAVMDRQDRNAPEESFELTIVTRTREITMKILEERKPQVYRKHGASPVRLQQAERGRLGDQRACVLLRFARGAVSIADALHLVHGPLGCAAYTWDIRGALSSGPQLHRLSFFDRPARDGRDPGWREKARQSLCQLIDLAPPESRFVYSIALSASSATTWKRCAAR